MPVKLYFEQFRPNCVAFRPMVQISFLGIEKHEAVKQSRRLMANFAEVIRPGNGLNGLLRLMDV